MTAHLNKASWGSKRCQQFQQFQEGSWKSFMLGAHLGFTRHFNIERLQEWQELATCFKRVSRDGKSHQEFCEHVSGVIKPWVIFLCVHRTLQVKQESELFIRVDLTHCSGVNPQSMPHGQSLTMFKKGWHNPLESMSDNSSECRTPWWLLTFVIGWNRQLACSGCQLSVRMITDKHARSEKKLASCGELCFLAEKSWPKADQAVAFSAKRKRHCGVQRCAWVAEMSGIVCRTCKLQTQFCIGLVNLWHFIVLHLAIQETSPQIHWQRHTVVGQSSVNICYEKDCVANSLASCHSLESQRVLWTNLSNGSMRERLWRVLKGQSQVA